MFSKGMIGLSTVLVLGAGSALGCAPANVNALPEPEGDVEASDGGGQLERGLAFVAVPRDVNPAEQEEGRQKLARVGLANAAIKPPKTQFYLAVKKSSLTKKWFLSAFGNTRTSTDSLVSRGADAMGTEIVELRQQNGKLYIFSADSRKQWSDAFDPEVIVEAYPIVRNYAPFDRQAGSEEYILVDPAQGLNNFNLTYNLATSDFPSGEAYGRLKVDLAYSQNFTQLDDGLSFEMVLAGYTEALAANEIVNPGVAMTMTLSFREYAEGPGFEPLGAPPVEHYFLVPRRVIKDEGQVISPYAAKWNVYEGMKPIEWLITRNVIDLEAGLDGVDLLGAVTRGIESWNAVFGYDVFKARLAREDERVGRDDRNFMIIDSDAGSGAAFAAPRLNPQTGEIRGASVYFPAAFFADNPYTDDEEPAPAQGDESQRPLLRVSLAGMPTLAPTCHLKPERLALPEGAAPGDTQRTAGEKLAAYVQHVVAHEVGHTLGLRHNFKGSLVPPSSSVMEYTRGLLAIDAFDPGPYDYEAIHYLYGLSDQLPVQPFCNDDDITGDPTCMQFDYGVDPVAESWGPTYQTLVAQAATIGTIAPLLAALDTYGSPILPFVRIGQGAEAIAAWQVLSAPIAAPIDATRAADPNYVAMVNELTRWLLDRLYLLPEGQRAAGRWYGLASSYPTDDAVIALIREQLSQFVTNADGVRSYELRRASVDALRVMQSVSALNVLLKARATLQAQVASGTLSEDDALLTNDLIARVDDATSPYFD